MSLIKNEIIFLDKIFIITKINMACQENDFVKYEFRNYVLTITIKKEFPENDEEWKHSMTLLQCYYEAAKQGNYKYSIIFDIRKLVKFENSLVSVISLRLLEFLIFLFVI